MHNNRSGSSRVKWNQIPALQIVNEDTVYDNHSSARLSCVRFSPPDLSRPTEVPLDETGVEFDEDKID
jgi:hypothetical protein